MEILKIKSEKVVDYLITFLKEEVGRRGVNSAILCLSGDINSTVVATLCKMAFGRNNTYGVILPYKETPKEVVDRAYLIGRTLGIRYLRFNITPQIDYYYRNFPQADILRKSQKMKMERMSILYDLASHFGGVVTGTDSKSEIYLGNKEFSINLTSAIIPAGDLYKTEMFQLADYLKIPEEIRNNKEDKLSIGEKELSYEVVDSILYNYLEKGLKEAEIARSVHTEEENVKKVLEIVKSSEFKRSYPVVARIPVEIKYQS